MYIRKFYEKLFYYIYILILSFFLTFKVTIRNFIIEKFKKYEYSLEELYFYQERLFDQLLELNALRTTNAITTATYKKRKKKFLKEIEKIERNIDKILNISMKRDKLL